VRQVHDVVADAQLRQARQAGAPAALGAPRRLAEDVGLGEHHHAVGRAGEALAQLADRDLHARAPAAGRPQPRRLAGGTVASARP
jgi:hypothetical protein